MLIGSWCDEGGRRNILFLAIVGKLLAITATLIFYFSSNMEIEWLWLDAVSELTGGQVGMFVSAYAIVTDQSDERMRTLRILVIAGLWHIAMAMGNLAAGLLLKYLTFVGLLAVSAGCHLLSLAYTFVFIREKEEKKEVT